MARQQEVTTMNDRIVVVVTINDRIVVVATINDSIDKLGMSHFTELTVENITTVVNQ